VLALRHTNTALLEGNYIALNEDDPNVLAYLRSYKGKGVLIALNMSNAPQKAKFNLADRGFANNFKSLLATSGAEAQGSEVTLPAFAVFIAEVGTK
jgi:glycosidase